MAKDINQFIQKGRIYGLDTMVFIYLFEENIRYFKFVKDIFTHIEKGRIKGVTSVITPIEILSSPGLENFPEKQKLYLSFFSKLKNLSVVDLSFQLIEKVSRLRRKYHLRTPDAIELATSIDEGAKSFITNDERYKKVTEINVIILEDFI